MSALNPNAAAAAARLPAVKPQNLPNTATAASHSAASTKLANAANSECSTEFSRLLERSQKAAAVSQRATEPAGNPPPPNRPVSSAAASTPNTDPAAASNPTADNTADAAAAPAEGTTAATPAQPSDRSDAARSKPAGSQGEGAVEAGTTSLDPAVAEARLRDRADQTPHAPPTADAASIAPWGVPPGMLPTPTPAPAAATAEALAAAVRDGGAERKTASSATAVENASSAATLLSGAAGGHAAAASIDAAQPAAGLIADSAPLAIEARSAVSSAIHATATAPVSDAALNTLALLSGAVRPEPEPELRYGVSDFTPAAATAIGGAGPAALARSIDAAAPAAASAAVSTPLADPGFHEALGVQVSLLAKQGIQQAELRLNPAEMGPVSVQITMNGDQARVNFGADLAQTRQVIEAGWAELAASLREAGFTLSGGGVSQHARDRNSPDERPGRGADPLSAERDEVAAAAVVMARPRAGAALDLYA